MIALLPVLLFAAQGDAQAADAVPPARAQTFIAPSGEPFRVSGNVAYPVAQWFAGADKNGDGKLDVDEFVADFMRFFDQLDVNHDGAIDGIERTRYENQVAPETLGEASERVNTFANDEDDSDIAGQGAADSDSGPVSAPAAKPRYGSNPTGAARFDLLGMPEPVAAMDTELRGRISRRVAEEAARYRFGLLDDQHLGYLTLAALPPTYSQSRHGGGKKHR
jgi:hypothetical protein